MWDTCQDKTSLYHIRPEDRPLLDAAISLGEWLAKQPEASNSNRQSINELLVFLRNLPNPPPHQFNVEFGYEISTPSEQQSGSFRYCWSVSVCRAGLEIFSIGNDAFHDFFWYLCPGEENNNDLSHSAEWAQQVSNPRKMVQNETSLIVEASSWEVNESIA